MSQVIFRSGTRSDYDALLSKDARTFYYLSDESNLYLGEVKLSNAADLALAVADIAENAADIADIQTLLERLDGDASVTGSVRNLIKAASDSLMVEINKKTTEVVTSASGVSRVWNEASGGGAKFEHTDGTWSFVGVNSGGENGLTGQLYTVKQDPETGKYVGTRLNMSKNGFFYTKNKDSMAYTALDEIATKRDIEQASGDAANKTVYLVENPAGTYTIYQGADASDMSQNTLVGAITITDRFVEDASVVDVTYSDGHLYDGQTDITEIIKGAGIPATAADAGKYIKMTLENVTNPIYVNVADLVDEYTFDDTEEISLSADANNNVTGTINAVGATKITYDNGDDTTSTVQAVITDIKDDIADIQDALEWQPIE